MLLPFRERAKLVGRFGSSFNYYINIGQTENLVGAGANKSLGNMIQRMVELQFGCSICITDHVIVSLAFLFEL